MDAPMIEVLRDFAAPFRRFTAGERVPAATLPEAERTALINARYIGLVITIEPPAPLPAVAAADSLTD